MIPQSVLWMWAEGQRLHDKHANLESCLTQWSERCSCPPQTSSRFLCPTSAQTTHHNQCFPVSRLPRDVSHHSGSERLSAHSRWDVSLSVCSSYVPTTAYNQVFIHRLLQACIYLQYLVELWIEGGNTTAVIKEGRDAVQKLVSRWQAKLLDVRCFWTFVNVCLAVCREQQAAVHYRAPHSGFIPLHIFGSNSLIVSTDTKPPLRKIVM